ncbi:SPFH domain-containing protein (plasmid) [Streptosporangium sandarakinum]|uniref:SPFH domain-containing protein n=1 Tax=Streptosporangium sandarakinum TaxID=1260955 RepID=UPI003D8A4C9F
MSTIKKTLAIAAVALFASACSITTDTNEVGLDYDYDSWSGEKVLEGCVPPGNRAWQDINDPGFAYPADQRSFDFSDSQGAESKPITVVSKDNLEMSVAGVATFYLNQDCKTLQAFHEKIGQKFAANTDEGWARLLGVYIKQPLDRAMDAAAKKYDWKQLFADPAIKQAWETEVATLAQQFIKEQAGSEFFSQFRFTLQQPQPPQNVRNALAAAQEAVEQNAAQRNKNEQVKTELQSIKELVSVLGPEGYVLYQAMKDGKVQIVPVPIGSNINVTPKN